MHVVRFEHWLETSKSAASVMDALVSKLRAPNGGDHHEHRQLRLHGTEVKALVESWVPLVPTDPLVEAFQGRVARFGYSLTTRKEHRPRSLLRELEVN